MRHWRRAFLEERCGRCRRPIERGDPLLEFHLAAIKLPKVRCVQCADYPPPDDLPVLVEPVPVVATPLVHVPTGAGVLPLDFKTRQIAREPGEEG